VHADGLVLVANEEVEKFMSTMAHLIGTILKVHRREILPTLFLA